MPTRFLEPFLEQLPRLRAQETLRMVYAFRLAQADPEDKDYQDAMRDLEAQADGITEEESQKRNQSVPVDWASMGVAPVSFAQVRQRMLVAKQNGEQ